MQTWKVQHTLLEEAPHDMNRTAKTPAANLLFNVNEGATKSPRDESRIISSSIGQIIILIQKSTPGHTNHDSISVY